VKSPLLAVVALMRLDLLNARNHENMSKRFALFFSIFFLDQAPPDKGLRDAAVQEK
jgi:hypothetical protein